ncbi:Uncharacterised protein [Chromobacterium violaceum]|uniref:Solute-binding protein family 3/N-terminal domain-containing protein n=1 Tax=Chromobacterium violaceum TaxID=536 RepID=A0A3S4HRZ4_CHRVL|nr:Uncharacterised protein [Chromobacterium violaceum]
MAIGAAQGAPLRACASDVDFPPYVFTSSSGFAGGAQDTGLAVNVLQRALRRAGREPAIVQRLPWRRCREMVAHGQIDIAIDVPTRELDEKRFLASDAYAEVHHVYFYSSRKYPDGAPLRAPPISAAIPCADYSAAAWTRSASIPRARMSAQRTSAAR